MTIYPPATAAVAGLAALLMPQLKNPLLAPKQEMVFGKTAAYLACGLSENLKMEKPTMEQGRTPHMKIPLLFVRSLIQPRKMVTTHATRYGGTDVLCLCGRPAELFEDGGDEGTEALDGGVGGEKTPGADVGMDVEDGELDVLPRDLLVSILWES
ncbi:hypothetical protein BJX76DRAFT_360089 [Aspergillus varians]